MANRIRIRASDGPLTLREFNVLARVAEGETHAEIASSLNLSRGYISEQMTVAVSKVRAKSSHQACAVYGRYTAYRLAADRLVDVRIKEPLDGAEEHVNHVLDGMAADLRARAARLIPR